MDHLARAPESIFFDIQFHFELWKKKHHAIIILRISKPLERLWERTVPARLCGCAGDIRSVETYAASCGLAASSNACPFPFRSSALSNRVYTQRERRRSLCDSRAGLLAFHRFVPFLGKPVTEGR